MTKSSAKNLKTNTGGKGSAAGAYENLTAQFNKIWREAVRNTTGGMSKKSHFRYRDSMRSFLFFCADKYRLQKIANVSEKHMQGYVEHRRQGGVSEKTLKNDLAAVRFFHRFANPRHELPDNQLLGLVKTSGGGKDRAWTKNEYQLMMGKAERLGRKDVIMAMKLARHGGLRIHECTRLTIGHLRNALKEGELEIKGKGGRVRPVPISPELRPELMRILEEYTGSSDKKIFIEPGEKTHTVIKSIERFINRHRSEITDRRITPHGLRHSYAREELARRLEHPEQYGLHRKNLEKAAKLEVAELLGHGRPEVTNTYVGK
ncbi:MAG: tyrosine-type recombinase/integrase [Methylomicrobium sp.]|nr:tyrosine-type recombinase/integrase [Methylomicrobium sp.]